MLTDEWDEPSEVVRLLLRVDEGRRGDIVEVSAPRARQLIRARAAEPPEHTDTP